MCVFFFKKKKEIHVPKPSKLSFQMRERVAIDLSRGSITAYYNGGKKKPETEQEIEALKITRKDQIKLKQQRHMEVISRH